MPKRKITYSSGRFSAILERPFAHHIWQFLTAEHSIAALESSTLSGRAAILPLLSEIETQWAAELASPDFPPEDVGVMVNNMIKQIMEQLGYRHIGCGQCHGARYIRQSGLYGASESD
jgi:hypothetical protein